MTQAKNKSEEWRGKIGKMTDEEMAEFLSGNPFCRIGCLADDGWPYVVPCWFEYNDGGFYIVPRAESVWARYIQRDGRVSRLTIQVAPEALLVRARGYVHDLFSASHLAERKHLLETVARRPVIVRAEDVQPAAVLPIRSSLAS